MKQNRRSAIKIMASLIGLVKPLLHIMLLAVVLGVVGYLCAIFLTITAGKALVEAFYQHSLQPYIGIMIGLAVFRGIFHYIEQYCNHFIAFRLLAIIRHKVFAVLRKLCPAKLEGRDRGNLISILTTDIELLEVFYAHTISPILIAVVTSVIMLVFLGQYHIYASLLALIAYGIVGIVIPLFNGKKGGDMGMEFRTEFGNLNSFVLDSLRGLDETISFGQGEKREMQMTKRSKKLGVLQEKLSRLEGNQRAVTNLVILLSSFGMLFLSNHLYLQGEISFEGMVIVTISMMSSFGPVVALASLSNNLNQTLASGERVLSILEEEPQVQEVEGEAYEMDFTGAKAKDVVFAYEDELILKKCSLDIKPGNIIGIHGRSGSGKSTLLKLLMRFWDVTEGSIRISQHDVREIPTKQLRNLEAYVTQETQLFQDTLAHNIGIGRDGATKNEIIEAAKKASLHDFILSLPNGYDTKVGELGDTLSGGEKQRIGIARAFLQDGAFLLLDEPTSNLDSLNEGIILKTLEEQCKDKTVVLVSHRESTMSVADVIYDMNAGRIS